MAWFWLLFATSLLSAEFNINDYKISKLKWKSIYRRFMNESVIEDNYYAFISPPTRHKTQQQLDALKEKDASLITLGGMPIVIKDNIMTIESLYPTYAEKLVDLGAIIFGKTNMHEFALGITSCNQGFGCCINPIDNDRICGGYVSFGLGTDTGGSVRVPSAAVNIIGYIATQDRYPTEGVFPLCHRTDKVGLMSNDIDEIIMVDWYLTHDINENMDKVYNEINIDKIKMGVPTTYFQNEMHPNIARSFQETLNLLRDSQQFILEAKDILFNKTQTWKDTYNYFFDVILNILNYEFPREAAHYLSIYGANMTLRELMENSVGRERDTFFLPMIDMNNDGLVSVAQYHLFMKKRNQIIQLFLSYFKDNNFDIIAYPTITVEPPLRIKEEDEMESNGKKYKTPDKVLSNTLLTALTGLPCVTVPGVKIKYNKFAVGFEMCSLPNTDEKLLKIAQTVIKMVQKYNSNHGNHDNNDNDDQIHIEL